MSKIAWDLHPKAGWDTHRKQFLALKQQYFSTNLHRLLLDVSGMEYGWIDPSWSNPSLLSLAKLCGVELATLFGVRSWYDRTRGTHGGVPEARP